jgi:hypothetical protein
MNIYFTNLYASWQGGSNENAHGLIRQYLKNYYPSKIYSTAIAFAALKADGSITAWGDSDSGGTTSNATSD